jgi:hypothetical protein
MGKTTRTTSSGGASGAAPASTAPGATATGVPTASQVAAQLKTTLAAADSNANQAVQTVALVHQARLSRASRTVASLTAQYGASDSRVTAAAASVTALKSTIARVSAAGQQLAAPVVQVAAKGWALQGYVYDSNYQPLAKYTVFLVDSSNIFLKQYGFSYTSDTGYFLINYSGGGDQPAAAQLFIAIVDTKANPVYLASTAFQSVAGTATFQTIVIPAGGETLGDPSQAIRNVAFPGKDAQAQPQS